MKAVMALADGSFYEGLSFGAQGEVLGEVVFNTSMTGYQEIITDPSYKGQLVTMTAPLIGNTGINNEDIESAIPMASGFVVKEISRTTSNWRASMGLGEYLAKHGVVGIQGLDTRSLTRGIRSKGAQNAIISTTDLNKESLIKKAKAHPPMQGMDIVRKVSSKKPYEFTEGGWYLNSEDRYEKEKTNIFHIVAYDFGVKRNILRWLVDEGCKVTVIPSTTPAEDVLALHPDGIFLSNGPGDPEALPHIFTEIKKLIGKKPIFGICLGHQLLALALGAKTYKLKFGHRGGNQPVMDLNTRKVEMTSQNHGFAVDPDSLPSDLEVTHVNLNDNTVEGVRHKNFPLFSVQYHPEASPGPHDSRYLFRRFSNMLQEYVNESSRAF
ncbi:MAG: glutamine-hydrolyzing carbamoyl-phosphate synthase small subunit [Nitrospinota bacterium]